MSPDQVLQRALRILRSEPGLMLQFLEGLGITPTLSVRYDGDRTWAGPIEDWPEHVSGYSIHPFDINEWDLTIERYIDGAESLSSDRDPLNPARDALLALRKL